MDRKKQTQIVLAASEHGISLENIIEINPRLIVANDTSNKHIIINCMRRKSYFYISKADAPEVAQNILWAYHKNRHKDFSLNEDLKVLDKELPSYTIGLHQYNGGSDFIKMVDSENYDFIYLPVEDAIKASTAILNSYAELTKENVNEDKK